MHRLYDHVDLRVGSIERVKPLYDALMHAFGLRGRRMDHGNGAIVYLRIVDRRAHEAFGINETPGHRPNGSRIAFAAASRAEVDRIAQAVAPHANAYEAPHLCPEYTQDYYATFFEDAEGNKLEVCCR